MLFSGCHEDTIIKSSLTPAIDNIHTFGIGPDFNNGTDTVTIHTRTVYADSIITSTRNAGNPIYHALGWVQDPFAGNTAASIYLQFSPPYAGFTVGNFTTLDSLVLVLPYATFTWGDTTMQHTQALNVFRISAPFSKDTTFYNFSSLPTDVQVGTGSVTTGMLGTGVIGDSTMVRGINRTPHLRIPLNASGFSDYFQNTVLTHVDSIPGFTTAFPGLVIAPDSTGAGYALPYFIINNSGGTYGSASILAYMHDPNNPTVDTAYQFPYSEANAAHFNRITRNYNGYPAATLFASAARDAAVTLMQNGPGAAIDVLLPHTKSLPQNVIINQAELTFTRIDTLSSDRFFGPLRLYPQGVNSSNGIYTIADRYPIQDATLNFIDGTPRLVSRGGVQVTEYRVNIPRELQRAIVQGSDGLHLRIGGTVNFPAAYRTLVGGSGNGNPVLRPSINIIYSKQ